MKSRFPACQLYFRYLSCSPGFNDVASRENVRRHPRRDSNAQPTDKESVASMSIASCLYSTHKSINTVHCVHCVHKVYKNQKNLSIQSGVQSTNHLDDDIHQIYAHQKKLLNSYNLIIEILAIYIDNH